MQVCKNFYKSLSKPFWILLFPAVNLKYQAENNPDDAEAELSLDMKVCESSIISQPIHHCHCHHQLSYPRLLGEERMHYGPSADRNRTGKKSRFQLTRELKLMSGFGLWGFTTQPCKAVP